jgi:hypothetical protein
VKRPFSHGLHVAVPGLLAYSPTAHGRQFSCPPIPEMDLNVPARNSVRIRHRTLASGKRLHLSLQHAGAWGAALTRVAWSAIRVRCVGGWIFVVTSRAPGASRYASRPACELVRNPLLGRWNSGKHGSQFPGSNEVGEHSEQGNMIFCSPKAGTIPVPRIHSPSAQAQSVKRVLP